MGVFGRNLMRMLRPQTGFPVHAQATSLLTGVCGLSMFLTAEVVPPAAQMVALPVILASYWGPRSVLSFVQSLFDRRHVVFFFPPSKVDYTENQEKPLVALTIDDAPASEFDRRPDATCSTTEILNVLSEFGVKATWFIILSHADERRCIMKRLVSEGHELANHGTLDRPAWKLSMESYKRDVADTQQCLEHYGAGERRWFRPGHAVFTPTQKDWLVEEGYRIAIASVYPHDALDLPPVQSASVSLNSWHCKNKMPSRRHHHASRQAMDCCCFAFCATRTDTTISGCHSFAAGR
jgi:peptidoglycan/xylan/chitin deacetylase (PgdA/CDA1 family)